MGEDEGRTVVERYVQALMTGAFDTVHDLRHDDLVIEWPQSGERIRGRDNARAVEQNYPGPPTGRLLNLRGRGDLWVAELLLDYSGETTYGCSILELRDGRIAKETDYFAAPFAAPDWRSRTPKRVTAGESQNQASSAPTSPSTSAFS